MAASGSRRQNAITPRTGGQTEETTPQGTDEEEPVAQSTEADILLEVPQYVSAKTILPVKLTLGQAITRVQLGVTNADDNMVAPFPSRTRFSLNNGSTYYKFYQEGLIEIDDLDTSAGKTIGVQLDLSETDLNMVKELNLAAQSYAGATTAPFMKVTLMGDTEQAAVTGNQILGQEETVCVTIPEAWQELPMNYSVRRVILKDGENDTTVKSYESVPVFLAELRDETVAETPETETTETQTAETQATEPQGPELPPMGSLVMTPVITAEGLRQMEFSAADSQLPAGTYVMELTWEYEGITFGHTRVTFFVNFVQHPNTAQQTAESAQEEETEMIDTETKQTGGAEQ